MFFKKKGGDKKQPQTGGSRPGVRSFEDMVASLKADTAVTQSQPVVASPIGLAELERDKAGLGGMPGLSNNIGSDMVANNLEAAPTVDPAGFEPGFSGLADSTAPPELVPSAIDPSAVSGGVYESAPSTEFSNLGDAALAHQEAISGLPSFGKVTGADLSIGVGEQSPTEQQVATTDFAFTSLTGIGSSTDPSTAVSSDILGPGNVKQAPKSPADLLQGVIAGLPGFKKAKSEQGEGFVSALSSSELQKFSKELSKVQGKTLLSQNLRPSPDEQQAWDQHSRELHANFPKNVSRSTQVIIAGDKVLHPDVCMHCKCKNKLGMWNKYGFPVYKAWLEDGALRDANNVHSFVLCDNCASEHFGSIAEISSAITVVWARVGMKKVLRRLFADFDWMDPTRCDEEIKHLAGDCVMFVAYCRGVPVGFISFGIDMPTKHERKGIISVEGMYVRPTFQGFGVGYLLMDSLFRFRDWIPVYHYEVKEGYPGMDKVRDWLLDRYFDRTDAEGQYQFKPTIYEHNDYEPTV